MLYVLSFFVSHVRWMCSILMNSTGSVLPDVDVLWLDSAVLAKVKGMVPTKAPREDACFAINCSNFPQFTSGCDQKDNGALGTP
jgi:hypothetical protein